MSFQAHPDTIEKKTGQPPRKVVAGYFLSLDGVAEAPDRLSPLGTTKRMPAAPISLQPRTRSFSAAVVTTSGLNSGQAARSSLSPPSSTPFPSTSQRRRRSNASGPIRA
jgi:hypothetical protein